MFNLIALSETYTNGYVPISIDIAYILSVATAIAVIISKNPIVSVLFLIGLFLSIASYLFIVGLNFIALSYLLVYIGAVTILFLFILMLINIRVSELHYTTKGRANLPLAFVVALAFNYPVSKIVSNLNNPLWTITSNANSSTSHESLLFITSKCWETSLAPSSHISSIGAIMYSSTSIWLIITSIILLLAMVGAIVITIKQR